MLLVYSNDTFELISFGFSIKTTAYIKFMEIARRIEPDKIINILFVTEMYTYDINDINNLNSQERIKHVKNEILAFYMIDNHLSMKFHGYDTKLIDDFKYIASVMHAPSSEQELPRFMNPIIQEFTRIKSNTK